MAARILAQRGSVFGPALRVVRDVLVLLEGVASGFDEMVICDFSFRNTPTIDLIHKDVQLRQR
jgi:hypothetical protein